MNQRLVVVWCVMVLACACLLFATGCESKVNQDNWDKITMGMTQGDVEGILGPGTKQEIQGTSISGAGVAGGAARNSLDTYLWKMGTREVSITFKDGKVMAKNP
jgi:hypothetical protein